LIFSDQSLQLLEYKVTSLAEESEGLEPDI